jgi:hypothetical protein
MSEERPLRREDFRRVMSHTPSAECDQLCEEKERLEEQWFQALQVGDEVEMNRLEVLIRAILTRMQWMHCPDCPLPQ